METVNADDNAKLGMCGIFSLFYESFFHFFLGPQAWALSSLNVLRSLDGDSKTIHRAAMLAI